MNTIFENILIMILTIVVLLVGGYLLLVLLGWWYKIKVGEREQKGLTDLWIASQPKERSIKLMQSLSDKDSSVDN